MSEDDGLIAIIKNADHWDIQIRNHGLNLVGKYPEEMFKQHLHHLYKRFMQELERVKGVPVKGFKI